MKQVYLSLGSNIGKRLAALQTAVDKLHKPDFQIARISSVYETAAVDYREQPDFLNIVVEAQTALFPMQLLHRTQRVEREMGRKRTVPKGPRVIDIDILLYGAAVVRSEKLQVPHPRMQDRRFVLAPMAELAGELRHPITRQSVREMLAATSDQLVRRTTLSVSLSGGGSEERP